MGDDNIWNEIPYVRKVGRYCFFAVCAFGIGLVGYVVGLKLSFPKDVARLFADIVIMSSFLALRDMSKEWDRALFARARASLNPDPEGGR